MYRILGSKQTLSNKTNWKKKIKFLFQSIHEYIDSHGYTMGSSRSATLVHEKTNEKKINESVVQ